MHAFDALHLASAVVGKADLFITADHRLLKRVRHLQDVRVFFPAEALAFLENWYEQIGRASCRERVYSGV